MAMKTVQANGISISVHDEGTGTPLLFVHGFPLDHSMWHGQLDSLATDYRVIAPDLRGFGQSTVTEGVVTMETYADDLAALLDELGIDSSQKIVLCGLSMGGYIAWQFHRKYKDRLLGLILCDTRAIADSPEAVANRKKLAATVLEHGTEPVAAAMMPKLFSAASNEYRQATVELTRQCLLATSPQGIAAASLGMAERPDVTADLPSIEVPALLIVGEDDQISTVEEMRGIAEAMPNADLLVIPEAGHMSPLENPELVNQAIRKFVSRLQEPVDKP
jgi:3-oxoadipate enol-lactonase